MDLFRQVVLMGLVCAFFVGATNLQGHAIPVSLGVYAQSPLEFEDFLPTTPDYALSVGARVWWLSNIASGFWVRLAPSWVQTTAYLFEGSYRFLHTETQNVWTSAGAWIDLNPVEIAVFGLIEATLVRRGPLDFGVGLWVKVFPRRIELGVRFSGYFTIDFFPNPNRASD